MAARWGAGEETLTIGGMELFTAGGPLQCNELEEDESCSGFTDLALSSLDVGILGTFQGYIDNSIISIIDDSGTQTENKGHFDEENELSLLTALTEILDNADDENMSPFDSIPDTELMVSPKDRDSCSRFLSMSRTPPERENPSVEDSRRVNYAKVDIRCPGPNWDLFPDSISSTPIKRTRQKSVRAYLPRRARTEHTQQRSDGEEEEVPEKKQSQNPNLPLERESSLDSEDEIVDFDDEQLTKHGTPCIINTENVPLNDLVKYMHPYCLPAITVCLDSEDENLLDEAVFLEIVSDQGESIKVPVMVEEPGDLINYQSSEEAVPILHTSADVVANPQNISILEPTSEQCVSELDVNKNVGSMEDKEMLDQSAKSIEEKMVESIPEVENMTTESLTTEGSVDNVLDVNQTGTNDSVNVISKKNNEVIVPVSDKEKVLKGKKSIKDKHLKSSKSKAKSKNKVASEIKPQEVQEVVLLRNATQSAASRSNNPSLQESDFLIKTLDQVKKESQLEMRSSKSRNKTRSRPSFDNPEKKISLDLGKKEAKMSSMETEQPKCIADAKVDDDSEKNIDKAGDLGSQSDMAQEHIPNDKFESHENISATGDIHEDIADVEQNETVKEAKPKSLSLSEYRKRLLNRKAYPDQENENSSCSKWPSIPEPPTELAELPCLIVSAKSNKGSVQEKPSPSKPESNFAQVPATSNILSPNVPVAPVTPREDPLPKPADDPCLTAMDTTLPPIIPSQTNIPPPFFPPTWPTIPTHPPFYPGVPSLPVVPPFPNTIPLMMPMQPPPSLMSWPPFPPPPIGPIHPNGWASGLPPPYWPNPHVSQGMPEAPVPFSTASQVEVLNQNIPQDALVPSREHSPPKQQRPAQIPADSKSGKKDQKAAETPDGVKSGVPVKFENINSHSKPRSQACSEPKKSDSPLAPAKMETTLQPESKKASLSIPDLKSANELVCKIMEILKKAQKCGFQIKPPLLSTAQKTEKLPEANKSAGVNVLNSAEPEKASSSGVGVKDHLISAIVKSPALPVEQTKMEAATSTPAEDEKTSAVNLKAIQESVLPAQALCTPSETSSPNLLISNQKEQAESFAGETGIEACDLTSLLEEFEKSEAKDKERLPHSPDKMAVGNSGSQKPLEKKSAVDKHLAPELVNTAGLTPPATPPHQLWKSASGSLNGNSKPLQLPIQEKPCASTLKTTKLIEPKPLPQSKLKNRTTVSAPSMVMLPVHVGSGDHDYCILTVASQEKGPETGANRTNATNPSSQKEEGSRWNVKHHQHIVIKPIVQFNKWPQSKACPKQTTPTAPSVISNQSTICASANPVTPCRNIQKDGNDPLDHRTNVLAASAVKSLPGSVLMSPDSSPCRSEHGETRTDVRSEKPSMSRRSLRCYRKYRDSPSPPKSTRRGRSSGSRSGSSSSSSSSLSSSSSSRSRSRSPPTKRRRTYRSRSHHRSRSSSRSSYDSRSSSRSSSASSRSYSPSSSRSRSRSRSPSRRRYRSRSRRCESRDSYYRERIFHKERAIEERRVVYIGKINSRMTRSELKRRFSVFGDIEECTIHFREEGDNYGFVTYRYTSEAFAAIENGHKLRLPDELPFDLCFGGRRQFCKSNYADLDSNHDDYDPAPIRSKFEALDFDTLLREAQKNQRR